MCYKRSFKLLKVLVVAFQNSKNGSMICNYIITKADIIPYIKWNDTEMWLYCRNKNGIIILCLTKMRVILESMRLISSAFKEGIFWFMNWRFWRDWCWLARYSVDEIAVIKVTKKKNQLILHDNGSKRSSCAQIWCIIRNFTSVKSFLASGRFNQQGHDLKSEIS